MVTTGAPLHHLGICVRAGNENECSRFSETVPRLVAVRGASPDFQTVQLHGALTKVRRVPQLTDGVAGVLGTITLFRVQQNTLKMWVHCMNPG